MAQKFDHVKTDILPDGSQSEPDYRHLMSVKQQDESVLWYGVVSILILMIYMGGFACGAWYGYERGKRDQVIQAIVRGVK